MKRYRIAVDIGGTFTDVVLFDPEAGTLETVKVLSTHQDLSVGICRGYSGWSPTWPTWSSLYTGRRPASMHSWSERACIRPS